MFLRSDFGDSVWRQAVARGSEPHYDPEGVLDRGYKGWIFYLDSDAFFVDLSFDLADYLANHADKAVVAAPSGHLPPRWWEINNGVFAINLTHPLAQELVRHWHGQLCAIPEEALKAEERWGDVADDQQMMHRAIQEVPGFEAALAIDTNSLINWEGRFIHQVVRESGSFEQRRQRLSAAVDHVLTETGSAAQRTHQGVNAEDVRAQANEEFTLERFPADVSHGGFTRVC